MNILITGGAGFIGHHLTKELLRKKHTVFCADNLQTGSRKNIQEFMSSKKYRFIKHDIIKPLQAKLPKLDQIYNLACAASPWQYQADAVHTIKTNTFGVYNMLELAKKHHARFFHSSTSEVYGDPLEHPQKESYWGHVNPNGPRSCYDEGKRVAESLIMNYSKQYGVKIRIVRIFNTYGPYMAKNDGRVVSNFIVQALQGKNITIYGTGQQTRSFCYVDDLVRGFQLLMNQNSLQGPVNLGNPGEFTINELAKKVLAITQSISKIVRKKLPQDDPEKRRPDISLAWKKLHWKPKIILDEGIIKTINYFKNNI